MLESSHLLIWIFYSVIRPCSAIWRAHFPSCLQSCEYIGGCPKEWTNSMPYAHDTWTYHSLNSQSSSFNLFSWKGLSVHWNPDAVIQNPAVLLLEIINLKIISILKSSKIRSFFKVVSLSGCDRQFGVGISVFPCMCQYQRESTCSCIQIRDIFHMCTLYSVLPHDHTLRYYAGKVATFCSVCLRKWEACLTPASWLWDFIPQNLLPAWLTCGDAGFEW